MDSMRELFLLEAKEAAAAILAPLPGRHGSSGFGGQNGSENEHQHVDLIPAGHPEMGCA